MATVSPSPLLPVANRRGAAVHAELRAIHDGGPQVGWFRLEGGKHRGAIGTAEGETILRLVTTAMDAGVPIVGVISSSGADVQEGVASLHAWGHVARALAMASGTVPIALAVIGPCVSGPALLLGLADIVVLTDEAFAYVSGPDAVLRFTGRALTHQLLGGPGVHAKHTGVAALTAVDEDDAVAAIADVLAYLPQNNLGHPPVDDSGDRADRLCRTGASIVPDSPTASYDVREVIADIADAETFLELRAGYAPNLVTGLARIAGMPVGVVANQPSQLAGTLDIEASQKGARFVQWCDSFNVPIVTLVDTPGFQPGKDIEWRGMIRHGAQLVHAYAEATVPRLCVILRKAYGGAYIVMDSKTLGNDLAVAWPLAEIAVMGANGAVQILHGRRIDAIDDDHAKAAERERLAADYAAEYLSPAKAAERGFIDDVIDPASTRLVLAQALVALAEKRDHHPKRRHSNTPL
ncbi:MAG: acyl-CoA carboxylase subunit beta [Acidimicrobiales bacterium]